MKVLIIKTNPFNKDGITSVVMNLYNNINNNEVHMDFVANGEIEQVYLDNFKKRNSKCFVIRRSFKNLINYINSIRKIVRNEKYDIVHIHGNSHTTVWELFAAKLGGCSIRIVHAHTTHSDYPFIHKLLTPLFNYLCTCQLACGIEAGKFMYGRKNFKVISNGIDTNRFRFNKKYRKIIRKYLKLENKKVLCHVGMFAPVKNHLFLLDIMNEMRKNSSDYKLLLIGTGTMIAEIKQKARSMNIENDIIFVGSTDVVEQYLSASDLFLMPSLYEGLPLSLIEAQANGLRCIVSEKITIEVDKTGNLIFLPIDNGPDCWTQAIRAHNFSSDRASESEMAVSKIIKNGYSILDESKKLVSFYLSLMN